MSEEEQNTIKGEGPYRVEQEVGGMRICYQAPTKEEALQMAGMALDPAAFVWDAKCIPEDALDDHIFDGWEPLGGVVRTPTHGREGFYWLVRRKIFKPAPVPKMDDSDTSESEPTNRENEE